MISSGTAGGHHYRWGRPGRSVGATSLILCLVTAGTVGLAGPASAHHALTGSDPADGSTVTDPPTSISLTFDQPVQDPAVVQIQVVVTGPDDQQYQDAAPTTTGNVISAAVAPLTAAGQYAVGYRVVTDQGAVGGVIHFTVLHPAAGTGPATPRPRVTPPPAETTAGGADPASGGLAWWIWAVLAAVTAAAAVMLIRDMRATHGEPADPTGTEPASRQPPPGTA